MVLAIYGSGGLGISVLDSVNEVNRELHTWDTVLFIDDVTAEKQRFGVDILPYDAFRKEYPASESVGIVIAVGEPQNRERLYEKIRGDGYRLETLIHRDAFISPYAVIGEGAVLSRCAVHAGCVIGKNVMIAENAVISHDSTVGDHCCIAPTVSVAGHCTLGKGVFVGSLSAMKDQITVGDYGVVAMSSAVYKDVPENCVAFGNPARILSRQDGAKLF